MRRHHFPLGLAATLLLVAAEAGAVASAELYQNQTYTYGRFEARVRFAAGDGIISSFFLWKPGSEVAGTFWNELDFEKLGADCRLQTNPLYGLPVVDHSRVEPVAADLCNEYHTYTFEWTPSYIAYLVDGVELRRDGAEAAAAFNDNAASGMQIHFNIWPGDATFGGNFDAASLPVQQYISWVQYSSFEGGNFTLQWREEFDGPTVPSGWAVGTWPSPKNLSTHQPVNVTFSGGVAVLSLTADGAPAFAGAPPPDLAMGGAAGSGPGTGTGGASPVPPSGAAGGGATSETAPAPAGGGGSGTGSQAPEAPSGAATGSAAGSSGTPASAPGRASSSSSCRLSPATAAGKGAGWLALGWLALLVLRRGRCRLEKGRTASMPSRC